MDSWIKVHCNAIHDYDNSHNYFNDHHIDHHLFFDINYISNNFHYNKQYIFHDDYNIDYYVFLPLIAYNYIEHEEPGRWWHNQCLCEWTAAKYSVF